MRLNIKPLSVNQAWKGKRFKSNDYKAYEFLVVQMLKGLVIPDGYLELSLVFGFSSKGSDFDNPVKPFVDCLQKRYGFNDNKIKRCIIEVEHVPKGKEFIEWDLTQLKVLFNE